MKILGFLLVVLLAFMMSASDVVAIFCLASIPAGIATGLLLNRRAFSINSVLATQREKEPNENERRSKLRALTLGMATLYFLVGLAVGLLVSCHH
jgi:hypothetical protein